MIERVVRAILTSSSLLRRSARLTWVHDRATRFHAWSGIAKESQASRLVLQPSSVMMMSSTCRPTWTRFVALSRRAWIRKRCPRCMWSARKGSALSRLKKSFRDKGQTTQLVWGHQIAMDWHTSLDHRSRARVVILMDQWTAVLWSNRKTQA